MRLGGQLLRHEMADARADPLVEKVATGIARQKRVDILVFAMTGFVRIVDFETLEIPLRERFATSPADIEVIDAIASALGTWRADLGAEEQGRRKGAIVERLVANLLAERDPPVEVHPETRVQFTSGEETAPIDVLGVCGARDWEALECKAGAGIPDGQAAEIGYWLRLTGENADELIVAVASMASRESLVPRLRLIPNYQRLHFLSLETVFSIAEHRPEELVPAT